VFSGIALTSVAGDAPWLEQAVERYPLVIFAGGLLLAWRFRRSRVGAALLGLILLDRLLRPTGASVVGVDPISVDSGAVDAVLGSPWGTGGIVLLLALAVFAVVKDRGVFSGLGVLQLVGVALAFAAGLVLWDVRPDALSWTWAPFLPWVPAERLGLSDGAVVVGLLALVVTLGMAIRRDHPVEKGLFWATLAVLFALGHGADSVESTVHLTAGALVLALAVVETSYAMAFRDELTGLPARRALWQEIETAGRSYTVAMVDVDHLKKFNDRHGHDVGDQVLRLVGAQFGKVGGGGRAFRYGGEEFTIVFPGKGREDALPHLEELRERIEESRFEVRRMGRPRRKPAAKTAKKKPPRRLSVTVSIGVAERTEKAASGEAVVKGADKALYRAKKAGRNRVAK
jgi:diguanylate cyclase (GGDEF)-like protein